MTDFFFATNKIGYYLLTVPKKLRYSITLGSLFCIIVLWFFFIYNPLKTNINATLHNLNHIQSLQASEEKNLAENIVLQEKVNNKQKKFLQAQNNLKKNYKSINEIIMIIFNIAHKTNLTVGSYSPQEEVDKFWYRNHSCKTEFQGTYSDILSFLEDLKKSSLFVYIHAMQIHKINASFLNLVCDFNFIQIKEDHEIKSNPQI